MGKVQAIESTALFHRTIWNDLITFIRILTFLFQVIRITLFFTFSWPSTMLLKNEHSRFEMTVIDYQFHGLLDSTYDSNWLVIEPFHKSWSASDPCVLTFMIFQLSTGRAWEPRIRSNRLLHHTPLDQAIKRLSDPQRHVAYDVQIGWMCAEQVATARIWLPRKNHYRSQIYWWYRGSNNRSECSLIKSLNTTFNNNSFDSRDNSYSIVPADKK